MKKLKFDITTEVLKSGVVLRVTKFKHKKDWEKRQARKKMQKISRKYNR